MKFIAVLLILAFVVGCTSVIINTRDADIEEITEEVADEQ
jgi:hypothetical protein